MDILTYLNEKKALIDEALDGYLPSEDAADSRLHKAMRYSLMAGGKRLRAILVLASCKYVDGPEQRAVPTACAAEMIHAFSLIHDDLPCMDNDVLRRGKPTCHLAFDEATAVLAGDALLTLAFEIVSHPEFHTGVSEKTLLEVSLSLARAVGWGGMIGGQMMDVQDGSRPFDMKYIEETYQKKTGALIAASVKIGALLGGASPRELKALDKFGTRIGLAFQIQDDILDMDGDTNKPTIISLMGPEEARDRAFVLLDEALQSLDDLNRRVGPLKEIARFIVTRDR